MINREIASNSRLGFIGLGYLGSRIAQRLVASGFPMVVYDRDREKAKETYGSRRGSRTEPRNAGWRTLM